VSVANVHPEEEEMSLLKPHMKLASAMESPPAEEPSCPEPPIVINKMVLNNFKSYVGRREIGPSALDI
jgi:structural maintenance of chromosome 4